MKKINWFPFPAVLLLMFCLIVAGLSLISLLVIASEVWEQIKKYFIFPVLVRKLDEKQKRIFKELVNCHISLSEMLINLVDRDEETDAALSWKRFSKTEIIEKALSSKIPGWKISIAS